MTHTFSSILGNDGLKASLGRAIANSRTSHAYLITGDFGSGKKLIAYTLAKTLNCESENKPCGVCQSCVYFEAGSHPDIATLAPEKNKTIGVDEIRDRINSEIAIKPYIFKHKIFIVESADAMTPQAQNALLKTLESPASYGVIILTAENADALLETIISRCVVLRTEQVKLADMMSYAAANLSIPADTARFMSLYSGGSIGRLKQISGDENFLSLRSFTIDILNGIDRKSPAKLLTTAKSFDEIKENIGDFFDIALMWYRDIAVLIETGDESLVMQPDILELLRDNIHIGLEAACRGIDAVTDTRNKLKHNANFQLSVDVLLLTLAR